MGYSFWPGDHRADDHFSDETFRQAMLAVETVWLDVLVATGIAPAGAGVDLSGLVEDYHEEWLVEETEAPASAPRVHRGRSRRYYRLTREGRALLKAEARRLASAVEIARDRALLPEGAGW